MSFRDHFLPPDELKQIHRVWSFRFAFVGAILEGVYCSSSTFQEWVSPVQFICLMVGMSVAILVARIMNQTGIDF